MPWNRSMFILVLGVAVMVNSKYLGPPDAIKMITVRGFMSHAIIKFRAFEVDTKSFKIELVGVHDGKSITKIVKKNCALSLMGYYFTVVDGLEQNGTYIVRVFSVNEYGQSPPSPDVILSQDDAGCSDCDSRLRSPREPIVEYMLGNRVKITWTSLDSFYRDESESPIEFVVRYGDNKNTSLWNTRKTNNTWIILDDLENDTTYSAYVIAKKDNLTSESPFIFPISFDEDMTGLPEPVITIESGFKKEVFTPGDPITIRCSIPPNSNFYDIDMELTIGERDEFLSSRNYYSSRSITLYATANENVDTAKCKLSVRYNDQATKSSQLKWEVKKPLNVQEVEADKSLMGFRKI